MASNWLSLDFFIQKVGGVDSVYDIMDSIDRGAKQADVAKSYGLDPAYLCRVMKQYFEWHLVPQADTLAFLDDRAKHIGDHNVEQRGIRARIVDLATHRRKAEGTDGG